MENPGLILQIAIGLNMFTFGVHQLLSPEAWYQYIPSFIDRLSRQLSFISRKRVMISHSFGNIILGGLFILGLWMPILGWICFAWFLTIIISALKVDWTVAVRDSVIAASILVYIFIS